MKPSRTNESVLIEGGRVAPRPFLLREFDAFAAAPEPEKVEEQEPEAAQPQPPMLTMTEEAFKAALAGAERKGREEGVLSGKAEGMALVREETVRAVEAKAEAEHAALQSTMDALLEKLNAEAELLYNQREKIRAEMAGIVIAMAKKLAGQALQTQPLGAVQDMVEQCVEMFTGPMKVVITVASEVMEPLKQFMEFRLKDGVQVEMRGDANMVAGDCRVDWPGGGAKRDQREMEREIEAIILRGLAGKMKE